LTRPPRSPILAPIEAMASSASSWLANPVFVTGRSNFPEMTLHSQRDWRIPPSPDTRRERRACDARSAATLCGVRSISPPSTMNSLAGYQGFRPSCLGVGASVPQTRWPHRRPSRWPRHSRERHAREVFCAAEAGRARDHPVGGSDPHSFAVSVSISPRREHAGGRSPGPRSRTARTTEAILADWKPTHLPVNRYRIARCTLSDVLRCARRLRL
jgi:hypothetical protein